MSKKIISIFIVTLVATILCGAIITYPLWSGRLTSPKSDFLTPTPEIVAVEIEDTSAIKPVIEQIPTPTPEPFVEYDINLMAVGDNLLHLGLVNSGKQQDGTLNYDFLFEPISDYLNKSDISIINQETVMAGNEKGFSGFPYFNSPIEVADAISNAGFNVVLQASNHTIDQGVDGLLDVCDLWAKYPDINMVGIHKDVENSRDIPIMEVQGIKFAILNYTYGPNLGAVPQNVKGHLNILCKIKEGSKTNELDLTELNPEVLEDIQNAKALADIVIVCPHWGTEYATSPSSYQRKFAKQMAEAGADVIIGAHPHAPEPVEWVQADNGNSCLCYYSLGNYVSTGQQAQSMLEGLAWVVFHVSEDSVKIDEEKTGVLPLVMQYRSGPLRFENVYALEDYTDDMASVHGIIGWGGVHLSVEKLTSWSDEIFGQWALNKSDILNQ